jgi:MoxR-like ATPase
MAQPVLGHRMALNFAARARGESLPALIARLVEETTQMQAAA